MIVVNNNPQQNEPIWPIYLFIISYVNSSIYILKILKIVHSKKSFYGFSIGLVKLEMQLRAMIFVNTCVQPVTLK